MKQAIGSSPHTTTPPNLAVKATGGERVSRGTLGWIRLHAELRFTAIRPG